MLLSRLLFLLLISFSAYAEKSSLILLDVVADDIEANTRNSYQITLKEAFSKRYRVFSGPDVQRKLIQSSAKTCNTTECLKEVAIEFQGELIGRAYVTKQSDGYFLSYEINNIFDDNRSIESKTRPCEGCSKYDVIDELQRLVENIPQKIKQDTAIYQPVSVPPEPKIEIKEEGWSMPWWGYVLGAVAVGAALSGGGDSGDSSSQEPTSTDSGDISASW